MNKILSATMATPNDLLTHSPIADLIGKSAQSTTGDAGQGYVPPQQSDIPTGQSMLTDDRFSPDLPLGPTPSAQIGNQIVLGEMMNAELLVELIDVIAPTGIALLLKYAGVPVKKSQLKATEKEKSVMAKPTQAVMNEMRININNPWAAFAATLAIVYGSKAVEIAAGQMIDKEDSSENLLFKPSRSSTRKPGETRGRKPKNA